jgi:hypothetical protein
VSLSDEDRRKLVAALDDPVALEKLGQVVEDPRAPLGQRLSALQAAMDVDIEVSRREREAVIALAKNERLPVREDQPNFFPQTILMNAAERADIALSVGPERCPNCDRVLEQRKCKQVCVCGFFQDCASGPA